MWGRGVAGDEGTRWNKSPLHDNAQSIRSVTPLLLILLSDALSSSPFPLLLYLSSPLLVLFLLNPLLLFPSSSSFTILSLTISPRFNFFFHLFSSSYLIYFFNTFPHCTFSSSSPSYCQSLMCFLFFHNLLLFFFLSFFRFSLISCRLLFPLLSSNFINRNYDKGIN